MHGVFVDGRTKSGHDAFGIGALIHNTRTSRSPRTHSYIQVRRTQCVLLDEFALRLVAPPATYFTQTDTDVPPPSRVKA
jgi:hypothetical protein